MKKIHEVMDNIKEFPTLPTIYATLLQVIANPRSTVNDVANIISQDIASSTKILKTVNSAVYHLQSKIDTISQAIFHLGFNEVKNLVMTLSIIDMFDRSQSDLKFNVIDLWKHSIAVGVITRQLGNMAQVKNVENYFLSGIIHDIGKLLFLKNFKEDYNRVLNYVMEHDVSILEAEQKIIGISHEEAGAFLAEKWDLPVSIINSVKYHSNGTVDGKPDMLVACLHLADCIARLLEFGYPGDDLIHKPNPEIWNILKIEPDKISSLLDEFVQSYEQSVSILLLK